MPTATASRPARLPSSSSRPMNTISCSRSASHASFEPKPARSIAIETASRMWASSNCWSVRTSTSSGSGHALLLDLPRRERQQLDPVGEQRPAVELDDRLEVRRLRPEPGQRGRDELVLVGDRQRRVVALLEPDRGRDLQVHARAAAHRAAEVPRPHLDVVAEPEQLALQRREDPARAVGLLDREVGPRDVVDEQGVAGQDRPRLLAAPGVDQRERGVLGTVARRVQRAHPQRAQLELVAVAERLVLVPCFWRRGECGSPRRSRRPACRGRKHGPRGYASRTRARCARPCSGPARGTRRPRSAGPRRRPHRRFRPRSDRKHSRDRHG